MKDDIQQKQFQINSTKNNKRLTDFRKSSKINLNDAATKLLQFANQKRTGILTINYHKIQWNIYLDNGKLQYAGISIQSLEDLNYQFQYLDYDNIKTDIIKTAKSLGKNTMQLEEIPLEKLIKWLKQQGIINSRQMSQLIHQVSQEALEPIVWLPDGYYHYDWEKLTPIQLQKTSLSPSPCDEIPTLLKEYKNRLQRWQNIINEINSPYQRPYFFNEYDETSYPPALQKLSKLISGLNIHQIAKLLQQDELELAQILAPYIQKGEIVLREPHSPWDQLPKIPKLSKAHPTSKVNHSVKDLRTMVDAIRNTSGLIRTNAYKLRIYPRSLLGNELVTWLSNYLNCSRQEAVQVGQSLIDQGWLHHTWDDHHFKDQPLFYRFYQDEKWRLPLIMH